MAFTAFKTLSQNVDDLVRSLSSKKITSIKSKNDLDSLRAIILNWRAISRSINPDKAIKQTLDDKINELADEASATNPMRRAVIQTLNEFNTILKRDIVLSLSVCDQTILHPQIEAAMKKFESSLKGPLEIDYFKQAEKCLENGLHMPFIVCSWSVVMYRLYKLIEDRGFSQFISAFTSMYPRTKVVLNALSDFYDISDSNTIKVAASKSIRPYIIDKQQKDILERNLRIRNMSAHVSQNFKPEESTVLVYIDEVVGSFLSKT